MELNTRGAEQTCTAEMFTSRLVSDRCDSAVCSLPAQSSIHVRTSTTPLQGLSHSPRDGGKEP